MKPLLDREPVYGLAHVILYAGGSITLLFTAGLLFTPGAVVYADLVGKRSVLRTAEESPGVDDVAVAEGVLSDD